MERLETPVLVIGGGVSGCACAAALATQGVGVTLLDPALDRLGEPSFGPVVASSDTGDPAGRGWLEQLPEPVREAWTTAAMASEDGSVIVVDRRLVGLLTKHGLEQIEGLRLRQGLVGKVTCVERASDLAGQGRGEIRVETAFGESLAADAVVIAVGLGLGESPESRWLPLVEGLRESLAELGAEFGAACAEVGPSFDADEKFGDLERLSLKRLEEAPYGWGEGSPASPYEREGLWRKEILAAERRAGKRSFLVCPDGVATGEVAVAAGGIPAGQAAMVASRPGHVVRGLAITNVDGFGRLEVAGGECGVWVTGRAGGSGSYIDSLLAGVRTGEAVAGAVGRSVTGRGEVVGG